MVDIALDKQRLNDLALQLAGLVAKKNESYGSSYFKLREQYGSPAFRIRLWDKLYRLDYLDQSGKEAVFNESYKDTLMDIIGYALLELYYLEEKRERQLDLF